MFLIVQQEIVDLLEFFGQKYKIMQNCQTLSKSVEISFDIKLQIIFMACLVCVHFVNEPFVKGPQLGVFFP